MNPDALRFLQRRLDDLRNSFLLGGTERSHAASSALAYVGGALEALRETELLSHDELLAWNRRFQDAVHEGAMRREDNEDDHKPEAVVTRATAGPRSDIRAHTAFLGVRFRRLIPGPDDEAQLGNGVVRIIALLVYDNEVEVDWLFTLADGDTFASKRDAVVDDLAALSRDERQRRLHNRDRYLRHSAAPQRVSISDDVGTTYEPGGAASHGNHFAIRGNQRFAPSLSPDAKILHVRLDGVRFSIPV